MTLQDDIQKIMGLPFEVDCFTNSPFDFDEVPLFRRHLEQMIQARSVQLLQKSPGFMDSAFGVNRFELQRHTASVDEHTDDVARGIYFGVYAVGNVGEAGPYRRRYDTRVELRYYDHCGRKHKTRIGVRDCAVFNPRRPHELVFYGDFTTLALFSVEKCRQGGAA